MLRRHVFLCLLALLVMSAPAQAQPAARNTSRIDIKESCVSFDNAQLPPRELVRRSQSFDCSANKLTPSGKHVWIRIDFDASIRLIDTPVVRATMSRHGGITTYVEFDDGSVRQNAYPIGSLRRQWRSPNRMSFPIGSETGVAPRTLLIGVDNPVDTENWDRLEIASAEADARDHIDGIIHSGILIGLMLGLLLVNGFLFAVWRAKFLAIHFAMLLTAFLYAVSWSGLIFPLFSGLTVGARSDFNHVVIAMTFSLACLLVRELCDSNKLGRFWRGTLTLTALLSIVATLVLIPFGAPDQHVNFQLLILALSATPAAIFASLTVATFRGSRPAALQLVGWSGLGVIIVGNLLHDAGFIADTAVLNYGFAPALLLEVVMTTVVVTLHVMKLRRERDRLDAEHTQLSAIASTDFLTNLPNRRAFIAHFNTALADDLHRITNLALICVDIDHFKRVNDLHGHATGDEVLVAFARILTEECRAQDYCARFGGEEFCILVASRSAHGTARFAERLRQRIERHDFSIPEQITASMGIALVSGNPASGFDELYRCADAALYRAKQSGRNRIAGPDDVTPPPSVPANDTCAQGSGGDLSLNTAFSQTALRASDPNAGSR
tara:strand:+ start:26822 stop:28651 length:1830 start_codon:yes stop_codon:yes gene_type:complete